MMSNNYWEIVTTTGETKLVPPQYAAQIKQELRSGQTHLTTYEPILIRSIQAFKETDKPYIDASHQLAAGDLTEAQAAFGPIITEEGVKCIAAKKVVPGNKRDYYQKIGYTILAEDEKVTVGFWLPAHNFDPSYMQKCTKEEARRIKQYNH